MKFKVLLIIIITISFLCLERLNSDSYEKAFKTSIFFKSTKAYQDNNIP
ncbi:hypothetical protein [Malaciobacter canalis]